MDKAHCILNKKTVSILGSNSNFGKLLSLLLKQSPAIKQLCLYDEHSINTACDIADINTPCKIRAFQGRDQLPCALKNADIVLIADRINFVCNNTNILLDEGAPRIIDYGNAIAKSCSQAIILVAATPVNTLLPLLTSVLMHHNVYDCNKVFGVTAADTTRANAFFAQYLKCDPKNIVLPVVGGNSPDTRVPIFSQSRPQCKIPTKAMKKITKLVKYSDGEVYKHKGELESVNKAYATSRFIHSVLAGLRGEPNIAEIALTRSVFVPGTQYFALPFILGPCGAKYRFNLPELNKFEEKNLYHAVIELNRDSKRADRYFTRAAQKKELDVIASKERGIMNEELLDHLRASDESAKVEYSLMVNKPQFKVPLHEKPSKLPVPSAPAEPFPHCYEGCRPLDLPVLPTCQRTIPPNPPTPEPPCKPIGGCKTNPLGSPLTGGSCSDVASSSSQEQSQNTCSNDQKTCSNAQNNSLKAQKCSSTQNTKLNEPTKVDTINENRSESSLPAIKEQVSSKSQILPSKASNKMVLSGSTEQKVTSIVNTSETNALQETVESKDKPVYHPIMLEITKRKDKAMTGNQKDESNLKMPLPGKNVSLISEYLGLMKKEDKTTLEKSKNLKNDEKNAKEDEKITDKKSLFDVKNINKVLIGRKSKIETPNVLKDKHSSTNSFGKYLSLKDKSPEIEKNSKAKTDPSMSVVTSMDKQILLNFLQKELKKDKFAPDSSKDDVNAESFLDIVSKAKQDLLKSLESELKNDMTPTDHIKDVLINKLDLLKSLESELKKCKSPTNSIKEEKTVDSIADCSKDVSNARMDLLKSVESELEKYKSPTKSIKEEKTVDSTADSLKDESNAHMDFVKSLESELKKYKSPTNSIKLDRNAVSKVAAVSKIKEKLLKSLVEEFKKDNIKREKNSRSNNIADTNFLYKLKQDLSKSLQNELKKDHKNVIKRIEPLRKEKTRSSLNLLKSYFLDPILSKKNVETKKSVKYENKKITWDYSRFKKDTEKIDENHITKSYIPYQTYAPKCPPQYLLGEYIPHEGIKEDDVYFDNVIEPHEPKPNKSANPNFMSSSSVYDRSHNPDTTMREQSVKKYNVVNKPKTANPNVSISYSRDNTISDPNFKKYNIVYTTKTENPNLKSSYTFFGRSHNPDTTMRDTNIKKYNITRNYQFLSGFNGNKELDKKKEVTQLKQIDRTKTSQERRTASSDSSYDQNTTMKDKSIKKHNITDKQKEENPDFVTSSMSSDSSDDHNNTMRDKTIKKHNVADKQKEGISNFSTRFFDSYSTRDPNIKKHNIKVLSGFNANKKLQEINNEAEKKEVLSGFNANKKLQEINNEAEKKEVLSGFNANKKLQEINNEAEKEEETEQTLQPEEEQLQTSQKRATRYALTSPNKGDPKYPKFYDRKPYSRK